MTSDLFEAGGIRVSHEGALVIVTLARPEVRNAQTPTMWTALAEVGRWLPPSVRAVVLRSEGPTFSAGLDRRMFTPDGVPGEQSLVALTSLTDDVILHTISEYQDAFTWWRSCDAITVAAVQGHAIGAGFQLALACDLIVADPSALFSMRETSLGLVPDLAGTAPLVEMVGYARALEMCASGRMVGAEEALRLGLAVSVCDSGGLDQAVNELLAPMVAAPAGALTATKHLLRAAQHRHPSAQRVAEREAQLARLRDIANQGA